MYFHYHNKGNESDIFVLRGLWWSVVDVLLAAPPVDMEDEMKL